MLRPNLYDYLKVLAIITMIIDHVGFLFFPEQELFRIVGRTAFPLFLFLVGYNHSYRWRNNLWIWGGILQLLLRGAWWGGFTDISYINILLAIAATRVILGYIQRSHSFLLTASICLFAAIAAPYTFTYIDYGTLSIVFAIVGYRARTYGPSLQVAVAIGGSVVYHVIFMILTREFTMIRLLTIIAICLIGAMWAMTQDNYPLATHYKAYDHSILFLSTYALQIYVAQAIFLALLYGVIGYI